MIPGAIRVERIHHFYASYNALGLRWCSRGKHWVAPEEFHKNVQWCKACRSVYLRERYDAEKAREKNFLYYYGHNYEVYKRFFALQGGRCAICKTPAEKRKGGRSKKEIEYLCLDHDHATGRPRGLLCVRCNMILGWMRDNPHAIDQVKIYLGSTKAGV